MNHLADVMRRRRMTPDILAERTGISRRSIYNWLDGKPISSAYLARVAQGLGVVPEEIQSSEPVTRRLYGLDDPYPTTRWAKARR